MVVALVAFLIAIVMFFLTSQEKTGVEETVARLTREKAELQARFDEANKNYQQLSEVIGYYDETAAGAKTDIAAAREGLKSFASSFPDVDPNVKSFQKAIPTVVSTITAAQTRLKDLETQIASLRTESETLSRNLREQGETNGRELAALRSQLADAQQAQTDMRTDLERQLAEARDQYMDRDTKWRQSRTELEDAARKHQQESLAMQARLDEQGRKLNPFVKEPEAADGRVLGISRDLNAGWVDLGANSRLAVGTRFRVVGGTSGAKTVKAWAEVTRVEPTMAEVRFFDQRDPYDPPVVGDVVYNPLFDPRGERHALLIGSFSGAIGEKQLRTLLSDMGVTVQKSLDKSTDFLIVGGEQYTDENGQPLAEPVTPSDLPVYKDAIAQGVQVVQLKDLRTYFRF